MTEKNYLFSYRFEGAEYGFEIPATSQEEARKRLMHLPLARYQGEVVAALPIPGGQLLTRVWKFLTGGVVTCAQTRIIGR